MPALVGFIFACRICLTVLWFQDEPETASALTVALSLTLFIAAALSTIGSRPSIAASCFRNTTLRWIAAFFTLNLLSLFWTVGPLNAAASYLAGWIADGNSTDLTLVAIAAIGVAFSIALLKDWRYGVYCFLVWLVFEDLIRKFTGNGVALFFAKDVILGLTYVAMWIAFRERRLLAFKPPFLLSLIIFFCVGVLEVFNTNIPNVIYGLLGISINAR